MFSIILMTLFFGLLTGALFFLYEYLFADTSLPIIGGVFILSLICYFIALYIMRLKGSSDYKKVIIDNEGTGEFHNDFSKVPSGPIKGVQVKPIDLSGNVFEHNYETLKEDMDKIGIDLDKKSKLPH